MVVSKVSSRESANYDFDPNAASFSPAQFEALMPDPRLKETLSPEAYAALMPDWNRLESDEPEMASSRHYMQLMLLVGCLEYLWRDRFDFFIGANLTIYYSPEQVKTRDYRGPDFFLVKNTEHKPRRSWVIWEEDYQFPNVIIELLSPETARVDRSLKKALYSKTFKTQEYFWFNPDPKKSEFKGFQLVDGAYVAIAPNAKGHLWSEELGLFLGLESDKLRFFYLTGAIVRTSDEDAIQFAAELEQQLQSAEQQAKLLEQVTARAEQVTAQIEQVTARAEQESARAEQESARADRLAQQLRSLGIDPDSI